MIICYSSNRKLTQTQGTFWHVVKIPYKSFYECCYYRSYTHTHSNLLRYELRKTSRMKNVMKFRGLGQGSSQAKGGKNNGKGDKPMLDLAILKEGKNSNDYTSSPDIDF